MKRGFARTAAKAMAPAVVLGVVACTGSRPSGGEPTGRPRGRATVGGDVVSTVEGRPIHLADVERVARKTGWSAKTSLTHLQEQEVLAAEARARGYRSRTEVRRAYRKALVQALLAREVERKVTGADVTETQMRAIWRGRPRAPPGADGGVQETGPAGFRDAGEGVRRRARMRARNRRLRTFLEQLRRRYPIRRHPDTAKFVFKAELGGLTRLP